VGKDTVLERWTARNPRVQRVVAYCTRPPRQGETDGVDYHFVSPARFHELAGKGAFLEHKEVHGNFYATPLHDLRSMVDQGLIAVLKIDVQGALEAMEKLPEAISIFLEPPAFEVLEQRMRERAKDSESVIQTRLENARFELSVAARYRHRVVNDDLESTVNRLEAIVEAD
jgi:guanylate kinase